MKEGLVDARLVGDILGPRVGGPGPGEDAMRRVEERADGGIGRVA